MVHARRPPTLGALAVACVLSACTDGTAPQNTPSSLVAASVTNADPVGATPAITPPGDSVLRLLSFPTFDRSRQVVHPDYVKLPRSWGTKRMSLVLTPYPNSDLHKELPSFYVSADGGRWGAPRGLSNPVVPAPTEGYLSDPDQVYVPEIDELWMYYRKVETSNQILLTRTKDGVHWTAPIEVVNASNHSVVSPSIVRRGKTEWEMFTVNAGPNGCSALESWIERRTSTNGIQWSLPERVALTMPLFFYAWHLDVEWMPKINEYWALISGKSPGSCVPPGMWLARSTDGVNWTVGPYAVLRRNAIHDFADVVYRSTFAYDTTSDLVTLWHSGARFDGNKWIWRIATQRLSRVSMITTSTVPMGNAALTSSQARLRADQTP